MKYKILVLALGTAVAIIGGISLAHTDQDGEAVKVISSREIKEKLDGKDTQVTVVEVTIEPGQSGVPHRHPGPGFGYVLEGEYELGIDDQPTRILQAGETFYEPAGCLHRVSKNPAAKGRTRLIPTVLHPRDAKEITIPEPPKK